MGTGRRYSSILDGSEADNGIKAVGKRAGSIISQFAPSWAYFKDKPIYYMGRPSQPKTPTSGKANFFPQSEKTQNISRNIDDNDDEKTVYNGRNQSFSAVSIDCTAQNSNSSSNSMSHLPTSSAISPTHGKATSRIPSSNHRNFNGKDYIYESHHNYSYSKLPEFKKPPTKRNIIHSAFSRCRRLLKIRCINWIVLFAVLLGLFYIIRYGQVGYFVNISDGHVMNPAARSDSGWFGSLNSPENLYTGGFSSFSKDKTNPQSHLSQMTKKWISSSWLSWSLPFGGFAVRSNYPSPEAVYQASPSVIAICHDQWHGIRQASYGQGYPVLEIPGVVSHAHAKSLNNFISEIPSLKSVIINGIPPNSVWWSKELKREHPNISILFIYHGSMAQLFHNAEASMVNDMIEAARDGAIDRVGIVKNGLVESFKSFGCETFEIWNFPEVPYRVRNPWMMSLRRKVWHVGVFGSRWIHKNVLVQIVALCQLEYVAIHVLKKPDNEYLKYCRAQIYEHGSFLRHDQFSTLMRNMDITLYVSLTECFPMTVVESFSVGIPSLTSATSAVYSLDPVLEKYLVVRELDSPDMIAASVRKVVENYDEISLRLWNLLPLVEFEARRKMNVFIKGDPARMKNSAAGAAGFLNQPDFQVAAPLPKLANSNEKPAIALVVFGLTSRHQMMDEHRIIMNSHIKSLLMSGHKLALLFVDADDKKIESWKSDMNFDKKSASLLKTFSMQSVAEKFNLFEVDSANHKYKLTDGSNLASISSKIGWNSRMPKIVAQSLSKIYHFKLKDGFEGFKFDILEFPDFGGLGVDLLSSDQSYIPTSVVTAVRLYGTAETLDQNFYPQTRLDPELKKLYLSEQISLLSSDFILASSKSIKIVSERIFGIHPGEIMLSIIDRSIIQKELRADDDKTIDLRKKQRKSQTISLKDSLDGYRIVYVDLTSQNKISERQLFQAIITLVEDYYEQLGKVKFVFVDRHIELEESAENDSEYLFKKGSVSKSWVQIFGSSNAHSNLRSSRLSKISSMVPSNLGKFIELTNEPFDSNDFKYYSKNILCALFASNMDYLGTNIEWLLSMGLRILLVDHPLFRAIVSNLLEKYSSQIYIFQMKDPLSDQESLFSKDMDDLAWEKSKKTSEGPQDVEDLNLKHGALKDELSDFEVENSYLSPNDRNRYAINFKGSDPVSLKGEEMFHKMQSTSFSVRAHLLKLLLDPDQIRHFPPAQKFSLPDYFFWDEQSATKHESHDQNFAYIMYDVNGARRRRHSQSRRLWFLREKIQS